MSDPKSSGYVNVKTANAGEAGVSGSMSFVSGTTSNGCAGAILIKTGISTGGKSGSIFLNVGSGNAGSGGSIQIIGGKDTRSGGAGGAVSVEGGQSVVSGVGGHMYLKGGDGTSASSGEGGDVILTSQETWLQAATTTIAKFYKSGSTNLQIWYKNSASDSEIAASEWMTATATSKISYFLRGETVIDCSSATIRSNRERDLSFNAPNVQLGDIVIMNPENEAAGSATATSIVWSAWVQSSNYITLRIENKGSSTYNSVGVWSWFVMRAQTTRL